MSGRVEGRGRGNPMHGAGTVLADSLIPAAAFEFTKYHNPREGNGG